MQLCPTTPPPHRPQTTPLRTQNAGFKNYACPDLKTRSLILTLGLACPAQSRAVSQYVRVNYQLRLLRKVSSVPVASTFADRRLSHAGSEWGDSAA